MKTKKQKRRFAQDADVDKRELIDEVGGFLKDKGLSDEDIRFVLGKMEIEGYNDSEAGANDEDDIDPIEAGIKEGEDEDNKPCGDEDEEETPADDEDPEDDKKSGEDEDEDEDKAQDEDDKDEEDKPVSMDEAIKYLAKKESLIKRLKPVIGDNYKFPSMNIKQVVKYACDKLDIKPSLDTLEGYLKAHSRTNKKAMVTMDSVGSYSEPKLSPVMREYLK